MVPQPDFNLELCTLQGYPVGFPVLLVNRLSQHRSADVLQFLMDGNFLDKRTKGMTAELLTYNSDLRVLGYVKLSFEWKVDGTVAGEGLCGDSFCWTRHQAWSSGF